MSLLMVVANIITAVAYFVVAGQLSLFLVKFQVKNKFINSSDDGNSKRLLRFTVALMILFGTFITLCGATHLLDALVYFNPHNKGISMAQSIIMILCAIVSIFTAIVGFWVFPTISELASKFEFNQEGNIQLVDHYLTEVVDMMKESVLVISTEMKVLRSNDASRLLFGDNGSIGGNITTSIHPEDLKSFQDFTSRVITGHSIIPVTLEYRVMKPLIASSKSTIPPSGIVRTPFKQSPKSNSSPRFFRTSSKIYALPVQSESRDSTSLIPEYPLNNIVGAHSSSFSLTENIQSSKSLPGNSEEDFIWVESTICMGMRLESNNNHQQQFAYDIKMVSRNIDDRKKLSYNQYQNMIRETEEKSKINGAKLRYISCITHDLKTPLQSFAFTMDLLGQTSVNNEQLELLQQAAVAVDLMRLTISQTMDISKALTGAKLMPRRTTVFLSAIVKRVQIIINGYGKQVPVSFEVAKDVCDTIITDEEWLWQMILNLLTNACKYTDRGGIHVRITQEQDIPNCGSNSAETLSGMFIPTLLLHDMLRVEVIDTGVGVPMEKLGTLFDAFSQVQDGQVTGTGLGLFGVRTRAEGLGGSCGARSNTQSSTGTGTVIWFTIPYVPDRTEISSGPRSSDNNDNSGTHSEVLDHSVDGSNSNKAQSTASPEDLHHRTEQIIRARHLTAMVVDDTLTVRKLMERVLLKMGFARVECYENGSKGLEAMMAQQVDIVFSDVQMPIMTGPEMISRFRKYESEQLSSGGRSSRQVVVAVTANEGQSGECGQAGFDDVRLKPLGIQDIQQVVLKYCA